MTKNTERHPCGCIVTEEGGRKTFAPCAPCGLMRAAAMISRSAASWWRRGRYLADAAMALGAVATRIRQDTQRMANASQAVDEALKEASEDSE